MEKTLIDKLFVNGDIFTGETVLINHAVLVRGDKIVALLPIDEAPKNVEIIDLKGKMLAPGYIDVQINGGGGLLFTSTPTTDALQVMSKAHEKFGVLNFCPTIISTDTATILHCLEAVKSSIDKNIGVLGTHLEGPFLEKSKSGVHEKRYIHKADDAELKQIMTCAGGTMSILTVAPEAVNSKQIEYVTNLGTKVFIGHTNATCTQTIESFGFGAIGVTHLFNAMSQLGNHEPGVVGASFLTNASWAGIIADGHHVDYNAIKIAKKVKEKKLFLVTDAMPPVGKIDVKYSAGGLEISCIDGRCTTPDGTLAGSALDMASAVRNVVQKCDIPQDEAIRMASTYVAQMLGIDDKIGRIKPDMIADMIVLNKQLYVDAIIRKGCYSSIQ
jgi:N-acetylglucosamine-6-phosphate deacetylase